jgi:hypothetical protein
MAGEHLSRLKPAIQQMGRVHGIRVTESGYGELIEIYPEHDKVETEVRLHCAWEGWKRWSPTPLHERTAFLIRLADLLDARAETYGRLITAEMGKPLPDAIDEIKKSALQARHYAEAGEAYLEPRPISGLPAQITYESIGPIFSVQPWNLPFWQALRFFNTTAMVGNTAIVKHAETVQGCAQALETVVRDTRPGRALRQSRDPGRSLRGRHRRSGEPDGQFFWVSTKRLSDCSSPTSWRPPVRFRVILAVAAFALAGCNANQTLNPSGQAALGQIYPNYNAYDPTKYGQISGFYAGR